MKRARQLVAGLLGFLLLGCGSTEPRSTAMAETEPKEAARHEFVPVKAAAETNETESVPEELPTFEPDIVDPGTPDVDAGEQLVAPEEFEHILIRAGLPVGKRFVNLRYEGNNRNFRGPADDHGLYREGVAAAEDWRRYAAGVRGLVVLRDSLFSQQDHPVLQQPFALMMPPSWVSIAVTKVMQGQPLIGLASHGLEADDAWARAAEDGSMFGSFPVSDRLREHASQSLIGNPPAQQARTRNARRSLTALSKSTGTMVSAAPHGPEAVATAGAAEIAASDRGYFGIEIRRDRIIPIFVENPNERELRDEGKGMEVWGQELPGAAIRQARRAVYARRLRDGALGIERYDLRDPDQRQRAISILEPLIPKGSKGHAIWLWVNGGSDGHGHGDPAVPYIADFRQELSAADVEISRLVLLSKPSVRPRGPGARAELEAAAKQHGDLAIPLSVQVNTRGLMKMIDTR